jgi:hypothetical protein
MKQKPCLAFLRARFALPGLFASALVGIAAVPWSDSRAGSAPADNIDFHVISSGGSALHSSCFRLSGTVGQAAPGYSSGQTNSVIAGFWSAAPAVGTDEIFFNGFQGC